MTDVGTQGEADSRAESPARAVRGPGKRHDRGTQRKNRRAGRAGSGGEGHIYVTGRYLNGKPFSFSAYRATRAPWGWEFTCEAGSRGYSASRCLSFSGVQELVVEEPLGQMGGMPVQAMAPAYLQGAPSFVPAPQQWMVPPQMQAQAGPVEQISPAILARRRTLRSRESADGVMSETASGEVVQAGFMER